MRLLVSVRNAAEARAAVVGGADLVDAKEPQAGALGAVAWPVFRAIVAEVHGTRPVTAALGDARDEGAIASVAAAFRAAGASIVKAGFAGVRDRGRLARLIAAAARTAGRDAVMAVAYADYDLVNAPAVEDVIEAAGHAGLAGVLIDTADKNGGALTTIASSTEIGNWAAAAHASGLRLAVAGKLTADDLNLVRGTGADICGVRGAACAGGRLGLVTAERVRTLRRQCHPPTATGPSAHRQPVSRRL